jgi:hypothetical protein
MRTIWKFQLTAMEIPMPQDAVICTFDFQNGVPCIWACVDSEAEKVVRRFKIVGTGQETPGADYSYTGTAQDPPFVWHLFEYVE